MATAADLMLEFATQDKKIADAIVDTAFAVEEGKADRKIIETSTKVINQSTQVIEQQKAVGEFVAKEATREVATNLGVNPEIRNNAADIISRLQTTLVDAADDADRAAKDIEAAGPPSFGRKLVNTLLQRKGISTETDAEFRLRVADSRIAEATKALTSINSVVQQTAQTQTVIAPTVNATTVNARATQLEAASAASAAQVRLETAKYNTDGLKELLALDQAALRNKVDAFQLQAAAEQRSALAEQRAVLQQERLDRATAKKASEEEQANIIADYRLGAAELNGRLPVNLPDKTILEGLKKDPGFQTAANLGFAKRLGQQSQIASSPGKAAALIYSTDARLTQEASGVRDLLLDSLSLAAEGKNVNPAAPPDLSFNAKDPASVERLASENAALKARSDAARIDVKNNSNIYQAPTPASIISAVPVLKKNRFVNEVILPQVDTGLSFTDPDMIFSLAESAIADGRLKFPDVANGIQQYFIAATRLNNTVKLYDKFALPEQSDYNAVLQNPRGSGRAVVDLTDKAKINAYLSRRLAERNLRTNFSATVGGSGLGL